MSTRDAWLTYTGWWGVRTCGALMLPLATLNVIGLVHITITWPWEIL